jgi:hypothetical protein
VGKARQDDGPVQIETRTRRPPPLRVPLGRRADRRRGPYAGRHTEPAIQLLEYEGHPGSYGIRFCYYNLDGRFQRSPMMIDSEDSLEGLRAALKETPRLREMLARLVK